jgi:hypothetical protein
VRMGGGWKWYRIIFRIFSYRESYNFCRILTMVSLFLQAIVFVCYCVFVCIYIGILAPLACFGL